MKYEEVLEEVLEEERGPRVPRSKGSKVPGSQGPRYLKLTFKYELDSKEGPSCFCLVCVPAWPWLGQGRLHMPVQARILLRHHQEHVQWQSG